MLRQHGHRHHLVHRHRSAGDAAADHQATAADEGHDGPAAADEGNPGALQQGPSAGVPRDDAAVPGGRCQPGGLSRAAGYPDAHTVRSLPGADTDGVFASRPPGVAVGEVLRVDTGVSHLHRRAAERCVPVDGSFGTRPNERGRAGAGFRFDVAPAEDDDDAVDGPTPVDQPDDDAVADAADDRLLFLYPAQRPVTVLDSI